MRGNESLHFPTALKSERSRNRPATAASRTCSPGEQQQQQASSILPHIAALHVALLWLYIRSQTNSRRVSLPCLRLILSLVQEDSALVRNRVEPPREEKYPRLGVLQT